MAACPLLGAGHYLHVQNYTRQHVSSSAYITPCPSQLEEIKSLLTRINKVVRLGIAQVLTVILQKQKVALREAYKKKKFLPLDLRPKKTHAIRRKLTKHQTHKYVRYFRRKGCKGYDKLCIIFGDTTTTGDNAHPSTKSPTISDDDKEEDEEQEEEEEEIESSRAKKMSKVGGKRVSLRQHVQLAMVDALASMGESNRKKMEWRVRKMSSTSEHSHVSGAIGPREG
ncbi:uncharacterized protein A4U43_C05F17870 [Asparagus officinalis]|uniref:Uncharacterized protein n=1 Tax=Asparagus officinalis TaxID=4686 RepID=A0A5P1ET36_ASPOF|nr:uncharacterized protein A4U43_C05F17870 [Asparagus officinalis]